MDSESCPLNPHLAGKLFCSTWYYVTRGDVHSVNEPFPWHSRDKTPKQFPKRMSYLLMETCIALPFHVAKLS
jgi:hypothetical protein